MKEKKKIKLGSFLKVEALALLGYLIITLVYGACNKINVGLGLITLIIGCGLFLKVLQNYYTVHYAHTKIAFYRYFIKRNIIFGICGIIVLTIAFLLTVSVHSNTSIIISILVSLSILIGLIGGLTLGMGILTLVYRLLFRIFSGHYFDKKYENIFAICAPIVFYILKFLVLIVMSFVIYLIVR